MIWNHGKHTWRWGGDFRRVQVNTETDSNPRGSFVFTGLNTSEIIGGKPVPGTGYDFADFLLGLPQQTSVQFGESNHGNHFRGNFWDLYVQDEWKMRGNLTLNLGVRYEYVSPLTEINNRIANLDLSPGVLNPALPLALRRSRQFSRGKPGHTTAPCRPAWYGPIATTSLLESGLPGSRFPKPWCAADMASTTTPAHIKASRSNSPCSRRSPPQRRTFRLFQET